VVFAPPSPFGVANTTSEPRRIPAVRPWWSRIAIRHRRRHESRRTILGRDLGPVSGPGLSVER